MWSQSIDIFNPYKATIESILREEKEDTTLPVSPDK